MAHKILRRRQHSRPIHRDKHGNMVPMPSPSTSAEPGNDEVCTDCIDEFCPPDPVPDPSPEEESCPHDITNWTEFKDYVLVSLGAPVVCVEVADDQVMNVVDDCIRLVQRYLGREGNYEAYVPLKLEKGCSEYYMDHDIQNIVAVLSGKGPGNILNWFSAEHHTIYPALLSGQMFRGTAADGGRAVLGNFESQMMYIKDIAMTFDRKYEASWREQAKLLTLNPTPDDDREVLIHCYIKEDCMYLYNNILFRKLAIAATGRLWARNLLKFASLTLPGGSQIAASEMLNTWQIEYDYWLERIRLEGDAMAYAPSFG